MAEPLRGIEPFCPRCGYDLSGHVRGWEHGLEARATGGSAGDGGAAGAACPVEGVCSECGLGFGWREVLDPDARENPRHVEHCRLRRVPLAAVRTWVWTLWPGVFFKRVRMQHEPRVGRMVLWLAVLLVVGHLAASVVGAGAQWAVEAWEVRRYNAVFQSWSNDPRLATRVAALQRADLPPLRLSHVAKAAGYPLVMVQDDRFMDYSAVLRSGTMPRAGLPPSYTFRSIPFWRSPLAWAGAAVSLGYPCMLLLLPATRRRLKIRMGHVWRAAIFGMGWLSIPILLRIVQDGEAMVWSFATPANEIRVRTLLGSTTYSDWPFWFWTILAWGALWWGFTLWRGLRFPRPLMHLAVLSVPVVLLALAPAVLVAPLALARLVIPSEYFGESRGSSAERLSEGETTFGLFE